MVGRMNTIKAMVAEEVRDGDIIMHNGEPYTVHSLAHTLTEAWLDLIAEDGDQVSLRRPMRGLVHVVVQA
jgi:hypothetical protein